MPLSMGTMRVDVSLCGSVPRSWAEGVPIMRAGDATSPRTPCAKFERLLDITSSDLNGDRDNVAAYCTMESANRNKRSTPSVRSKSGPTELESLHRSGEPLFSPSDSFETLPPCDLPPLSRRDSNQMPQLEPPLWAVPASCESRLEPVCEALGSHSPVDLSNKACFRVGRSPLSDVQLQHNTSSRRHALVFHHANGNCYVVDCGSSHGTYVNGVRVHSTPSGSMVIPHRVKRGSLIRFGGPGAPSFVLKSYSLGFSDTLKEDLEEECTDSDIADDNSIQIKTQLVAPLVGGILRKRSFEENLGTEPAAKRQRCVSPASFMLETGPIRLVSPDSPRKSKRVSFHEEPVAPVLVSSDEEENKA